MSHRDPDCPSSPALSSGQFWGEDQFPKKVFLARGLRGLGCEFTAGEGQASWSRAGKALSMVRGGRSRSSHMRARRPASVLPPPGRGPGRDGAHPKAQSQREAHRPFPRPPGRCPDALQLPSHQRP